MIESAHSRIVLSHSSRNSVSFSARRTRRLRLLSVPSVMLRKIEYDGLSQNALLFRR